MIEKLITDLEKAVEVCEAALTRESNTIYVIGVEEQRSLYIGLLYDVTEFKKRYTLMFRREPTV